MASPATSRQVMHIMSCHVTSHGVASRCVMSCHMSSHVVAVMSRHSMPSLLVPRLMIGRLVSRPVCGLLGIMSRVSRLVASPCVVLVSSCLVICHALPCSVVLRCIFCCFSSPGAGCVGSSVLSLTRLCSAFGFVGSSCFFDLLCSFCTFSRIPNSRMLWVTISLRRGQGLLQLMGRGSKNF